MIQSLSGKYQRCVAFFLVSIFYINTALAGSRYFSPLKVTPVFSSYPANDASTFDTIVSGNTGRIVTGPRLSEPVVQQLLKKESNDAIQAAPATPEKEFIGGPGQPEMSAFKAVGADNMVDLFTGDFSYNIPLGDVGGYPINIFYSSGISMDQEASWVGLGWNINPGTIMRNMRGVPDDFNGEDKVTKEMSIKPQITVGVSGSKGLEANGLPKFLQAVNSVSRGIFYNNYRGIGLESGVSTVLNIHTNNTDAYTGYLKTEAGEPSVGTTLSAGVSFNINSQSGVNVNPSLSLKLFDHYKFISYGLTASASYNSRIGLQSFGISGEINQSRLMSNSQFSNISGWDKFSFSSSLAFGIPSITPSVRMPLTHTNYNLGVSFGQEVKPLIYKNARLSGYYSESKIREEDKIQKKPAYGYLYYQEANNNKEALLDFNRLNDVVYTKNNPVTAIPNYTYDVFAINGQGTGGGFRAYRNDVGSIHDNFTRTKENAASIDFEVGKLDVVELGLNLNYVHTPNTAGEWEEGNLSRQELRFMGNRGVHQAAYFKNPAEAAKVDPAFLDKLGNDDLVRIKLDDPKTARPVALPTWEKFSNTYTKTGEGYFGSDGTLKTKNDKRTQVISFLTAEEASYVALDKSIRYYGLNQFPDGSCASPGLVSMNRVDPGTEAIRKRHHLSEITVTQTDGKRYIYGIPVYNLKEEEVSFNINKDAVKNGEQLVSYAATDLFNNKNGKDWFYQKDKVDPYAHSFLLSGLLSADYVDLTGDGISDDDPGTAVKFNYTKLQPSFGSGFGWRAPFTGTTWQAAYGEGLKTDNSDDKGHYTYGERELWYLNSIESKTMVATFTLADREDGKAAAGDLGGVGAVSSTGMKKLTRIDIYSKAEWVKTTGVKKPVKTIHFEYDYGLCNNTPNNPSGGGKLRLKSIYFTYNGNEKVFKNKYYFKYSATNPAYNRTSNDRWGTYKPASANASSVTGTDFSLLNNADFPFADQDKSTADLNAAAWTLNEITLPSGAKIKVDFESDDYGYVQNRRAAQLFRIAGFGVSKSSAPSALLYNNLHSPNDNFYIFVDVPVAVTSKADIKAKYLDGVNQLFMKLWVLMPPDQYGSGHEPIPVYAKIDEAAEDNYGVAINNSNRIWIKVKPDKGDYSPMFYNSMQFMIRNLSSKAYPGSDVKNQKITGIFKAIGGMMFNLVSFMEGYYTTARRNGWCRGVDITRSYIRLNDPDLIKLGGGHRVKKVTIKDSWKAMTSTTAGANDGMPESEYGQEYDYTTTTNIGGQTMTISSGVAAYEPAVGAEENPFREILHYDDRQPLGPNERGAIEVPLGEVFYPSPSVGYSKVTVRSIHRDNVKSGVGKSVTEFYTSKDFPTKGDFTSFDPNSHVRYKSNSILRLLKLDVREVITLSQGFRLQTNDMNGKVKVQTTFDEKGKQVTFTENIYRIVLDGEQKYSFNNTVQMLSKPDEAVQTALMGKEIELMTDSREHFTKAITFNMNFNINTNLWGGIPLPVPSIIPPVHYAETGYRSVSVLKIINTFGILEKVRHIDKGSEVSTKDLLYDAETGNVLLTETNNEFNKPVYSFTYPAHWAYKGMEGAYKNIGAEFKELRFQNGKLTTAGFDMSVFESGDELFVSDHSSRGAMQEPGCYTPGPVQFIPKPRDENGMYVRKIWALNMNKDAVNNGSADKFLFIDKNGEPYSGDKVTIKIIRSGKRNLVDAAAGAFTCLANPIRETGAGTNVFKLFADDAAKIINTTANTFKENWRVDEAWYAVDDVERIVRQSPLQTTVLTPTDAFSIEVKRHAGTTDWTKTSTSIFETFKRRGKEKGTTHVYYYDQNSWLRYSIPVSLQGVKIESARLNLYGHNNNHQGPTLPFETHAANEPHYNGQEEGSGFNSNHLLFKVSRMTSPWYTSGDLINWLRLLDNDNAYTADPVFPSIRGLGSPVNGFRADFVPDVKTMVQTMIDNVNVPGVTTGIKLSFIGNSYSIAQHRRDRNSKWRYCFSPSASLTIDYYTCSSSDPIIYQGPVANAPSTAPAGYKYCIEDIKTISCLSYFTKQRINPYTKGVLGNWRADMGYVYYANRRETSAATATEELSKGGVIAVNYQPFWISNNGVLTVNNTAITSTPTEPAQWKWNSKITQINSKGFELENTDPLGRFNSGIYGYDKSLPVAVANNSKLRSAAYDGFEDYGYHSNNCAVPCSPKRHLVIDNASTHLDNTVRHTGLYSLKLAAGETISAHAAVVSTATDEAGYGIRISTVTTSMNGTWVNPMGTGIAGKYFNYGPLSKNFLESNGAFHERVRDAASDKLNSNTGYTLQNDPNVQKQSNGNYGFFESPGIKPPAGIGHRPPVEDGYDFYCARWEGYIQAPQTGVYKFRVLSDDGMRVFIDGSQVNLGNYFINHSATPSPEFSFTWTVGTLHQVRIDYYEESGASSANLMWKPPYAAEFEIVPKENLYLEIADANNTVTTGNKDCVKPDIIQVQDNALTDVFSPVAGQKMVFSAWVKEGAADCQCNNYAANAVDILFNNSSTVSASFLPTGKIIDGWQRYEGVFTIPTNATHLEVKLKSTGTKIVYWDDLRLHPFNANMKTFVYHPSTLRLMAEQDENNYSSFYEYDDDGTLTRVKKETIQGIKTITETRSALQKRITD